jgi:hypothetical protein
MIGESKNEISVNILAELFHDTMSVSRLYDKEMLEELNWKQFDRKRL